MLLVVLIFLHNAVLLYMLFSSGIMYSSNLQEPHDFASALHWLIPSNYSFKDKQRVHCAVLSFILELTSLLAE